MLFLCIQSVVCSKQAITREREAHGPEATDVLYHAMISAASFLGSGREADAPIIYEAIFIACCRGNVAGA